MSNGATPPRVDAIGDATEMEISSVGRMIKKVAILCASLVLPMNLAFCQSIKTEAKKMQLPSFEQVAASPEVADLGVAVKLDASSFRVREPIVLHGAYRIDGDLIQKTHDEPLTW